MHDGGILRVMATPAALDLIATLQSKHGPVLFHQSGGGCDGSSPMCYPQSDYIVSDDDVLLGTIGGAPFYMSPPQYEYWKHTQLIIGMVPGRGRMFSLENGRGVRFVTRLRLFSDNEARHLELKELLRRRGRSSRPRPKSRRHHQLKQGRAH
jgi:uncharacterized protein (DUF779 family)